MANGAKQYVIHWIMPVNDWQTPYVRKGAFCNTLENATRYPTIQNALRDAAKLSRKLGFRNCSLYKIETVED